MSARQPISTETSSSSSAAMEEDPSPPVTSAPATTQSKAPAARTAKTKTNAPVKAPKNWNHNNCYGMLTLADKQVSTNRAKSERNGRNIVKLARTTANLDARMRAQERRGIKGYVKIDGKFLPKRRNKEQLFAIVRDLAHRHLGIRVCSGDVGNIRRLNNSIRSPILVQFLSSHISSVMYALTNPALKSQMKRTSVYWNRFQISSDRQIFRICSILKKKGMVSELFVDKNHLTNIVKTEGDYPTAITDIELFATVFRGDPQVTEIVDQNRDDEDLEMETETPGPAVVYEATASGSSAPVGNIIDVDTE